MRVTTDQMLTAIGRLYIENLALSGQVQQLANRRVCPDPAEHEEPTNNETTDTSE